MQVEIASPPARPRLRLSWTGAARLVLPAVILLATLFELALAERKYALFGGGFGQSQTIDNAAELTAFLAGLLPSQFLLFALVHVLLRRLHGRQAKSPVFALNFLFVAGLGSIGLTIAKYQALSYFSDAMSFQIVRNLGGGSLADALLFSLSESVLALGATAGAILVYVGMLWLFRGRWRDAAPLPDAGPTGRQVLAALVAAPLLLFGANRIGDARAGLARFNSVTALSTVLHETSDFDRDGWSLFSYPLDRQPFDGSRHPYALDVPGNGIDEDGFAGDLALVGDPPVAPPPVIAGRKRHVVLIVLESTRFDAIGRRVGGRPVTPNLDAMAARGSSASEAYSHVGFTTQSLQSLFSGRLAPVDDRQSLVRDFLANGYQVGTFSGQAEDFGGTAQATGMRRGAIFVDAGILRHERAFSFAAEGSLAVDGRVLLREFDQRLGRPEAWTQPHFLYFNLQSAHFPYSAPGMDPILTRDPIPRGEIGAANRDRVERTYWNAVAYSDRLIGELTARLRRLGVLEDTLIVVTADHGESLFDDGFLGHGHALNTQQTRIPFILSDPGVRLAAPIGLADMRNIILRAAGAPTPPDRAGGVFQYLGSLDRPSSIGLVHHCRDRIEFSPYREAVWTSRRGRWVAYSELRGGERMAADALINEWARQRWLARPQASGS